MNVVVRALRISKRTGVALLGDVMESSAKLGFWWLPDSPGHRVPGRIEVSEDGRSSLDVILPIHEPTTADERDKDARGSSGWRDVTKEGFRSLEGDGSQPLILGRLADGESVTLTDCRMPYSFSNPTGGFPHASYEATVTIMGEHFKRAEDVGAERLMLRYSHLSKWIGRVGEPTKEDDTVLTAEADGCEVRLRLPGKLGRKLGRSAGVTVEFPDERPLEVLVEAADKLQDLLTLGTRNPVRPLEVWRQSGSGEEFTASPIYFPWRKPESADETVERHRMLFSLDYAPGGFSEVVENWMSC